VANIPTSALATLHKLRTQSIHVKHPAYAAKLWAASAVILPCRGLLARGLNACGLHWAERILGLWLVSACWCPSSTFTRARRYKVELWSTKDSLDCRYLGRYVHHQRVRRPDFRLIRRNARTQRTDTIAPKHQSTCEYESSVEPGWAKASSRGQRRLQTHWQATRALDLKQASKAKSKRAHANKDLGLKLDSQTGRAAPAESLAR